MIKTVLVVEDNADDVFLLKKALLSSGVHHFIRVVNDGEEAIDYLAGNYGFKNRKEFPLPSLVFLDIKLPKRTGHEVLRWLRGQPEYKMLPVVMLTSSSMETDVRRAQSLGVTSYMVKESNWHSFRESIERVVWHWLGGEKDEETDIVEPPQPQWRGLRW